MAAEIMVGTVASILKALKSADKQGCPFDIAWPVSMVVGMWTEAEVQ